MPQDPFHSFPRAPSLFVTLIYFWHCTLAFSKGKTVGNLISGPTHPLFSMTSSPILDVTVAAPWCKWSIRIYFHPRGLTHCIWRPWISAAAGKQCTLTFQACRPIFNEISKLKPGYGCSPHSTCAHMCIIRCLWSSSSFCYCTTQIMCHIKAKLIIAVYAEIPYPFRACTHTFCVHVYVQLYRQRRRCQADLETAACQHNGSRHPKGRTAAQRGQIGGLSHSYGAYFTSHVRSSWQIPGRLSTCTNWIMSNRSAFTDCGDLCNLDIKITTALRDCGAHKLCKTDS